MVRFGGVVPVEFATVGFDFLLRPAHRARCASAILRREAGEMTRFGWAVLPGTAAPEPLSDSMPLIIWSNLSTSICAWLRFSRSSRNALSRFDMFAPSGTFLA
jgi:hypothetical protein